MAVGAKREKYVQGLRFHVTFPEFSGGSEVAFSKVSGLSMALDVSEYREGDDALTVRKFPGLVTYDNVSFERGIVQGDLTLANFFEKLQTFKSLEKGQLKINEGIVGTDQQLSTIESQSIRTTVLISVLDRELGSIQKKYKLINAFVVGLSIADIDASSGDVLIETMEMAHEGLLILNG